jgi:hypothetical protein
MAIFSKPKIKLSVIWDSLIHLDLHSRAKLTGGQISERSWAKKVSNFQSMPEVFRQPVLEIILDEQNLPYTVLTPTFEGYSKLENEKLIFCLDHRLFILENVAENITSTCYRLEKIHRIEFGKILLDAWIKICGINDQGVYSVSRFRFNSVSDYLFNPFIETMRRLDEPEILVDTQQEREKFSSLMERHIKFMNFARSSLLPGERVIQFFLQPEIEAARLHLFGTTLFKRTLCATYILIQTDRELILIQDDLTSQCLNDESRYGGIRNYVPLNQLQDLIVENATTGLVELTLKLPAEDSLHLLCANERRSELIDFILNIKESPISPIPSLS